MDKSAKFSMEAGKMFKDTEAFIIVKVDQKGVCSLSSDGNLLQLTFMEKTVQSFVLKVLDGNFPRVSDQP